MMNRNKKKSFTFSSLFSNNKFVFVFSLVAAVVCWCIVSISQTTETERVFQNVTVNINMDESIAKDSGLDIFGNQEFKVDVTVKGFSYIINAASFTELRQFT